MWQDAFLVGLENREWTGIMQWSIDFVSIDCWLCRPRLSICSAELEVCVVCVELSGKSECNGLHEKYCVVHCYLAFRTGPVGSSSCRCSSTIPQELSIRWWTFWPTSAWHCKAKLAVWGIRTMVLWINYLWKWRSERVLEITFRVWINISATCCVELSRKLNNHVVFYVCWLREYAWSSGSPVNNWIFFIFNSYSLINEGLRSAPATPEEESGFRFLSMIEEVKSDSLLLCCWNEEVKFLH